MKPASRADATVEGMNLDVSEIDVLADAAGAAQAAAGSAGLRVGEVSDLKGLTDVARLFDDVWSNSEDSPMISPSTLKAFAHAENYVSAAYRDGTLVGALVGFLGRYRGDLQLHSHILGVSREVQGRNIGFALKLHQRAWALERGIGTITWTFDPLVRRNGYFNLAKLGATITEYYEDFYGDMNDAINAGDESDRVLVEWNLGGASVVRASRTHGIEPDVDALRAEGAAVALSAGDDGTPLVAHRAGAGTLLFQVPSDIVQVRGSDPAAAREWRRASRATLGRALNDGYVARGMTRSGWYVLIDGRSAVR
jgi:predicted GNAT superfamily acetyltransferase